MMVGTYANGWLAQLRDEWCRHRCMKRRNEDQQLQFVSLTYSVAPPDAEPKTLSTKKKGLDANTTPGSHGGKCRSVFA